MPFKRITAVFMAILLGSVLLAGCTTKNPEDNSDNQPVENGQEQPADNGDKNKKMTMQVYFTHNNQGKAEAVPVAREVHLESDDPAEIAKRALELLQAGPTEEEKKHGLSNNLPGAQLLDLIVQRPHVILNFSREFEQFGGTYRLDAVLKQLTMTMSAIPGIKSVVLLVEGERVGTEERPFTGEGSMFGDLTMDPGSEQAAVLGPADTLDLFIAVIPDVEKMWALMGPQAREIYKEPNNIEYTAFNEGLGSWKNYRVAEERIEGDIAVVTIRGDQELEGERQPDADYTAYMVRENGYWKWDFPPVN